MTPGRATRLHTKAFGALLLLAVAGGVSGCGIGNQLAIYTPPATVTEPFAELSAGASEQERVLHDAEERMLARCMADRGFRYTPTSYETATSGRQPRASLLVAQGDIDSAKQRGYGIDYSLGDLDPHANPSFNAEPSEMAKLSPAQKAAYGKALSGDSIEPGDENDPDVVVIKDAFGGRVMFRTGTCLYEARTKVYGEGQEWRQLSLKVEDMANEVYTRVDQDSAVRTGKSRWQDCMKEAGFAAFDYKKFATSLVERVRARKTDVKQAQAEERRVAVADATCAQNSGYADSVRSAMEKAQTQVAASNEGTITRYLELRKLALERVAKLR